MRNVLLGPPVKKIFSPIVEGADNVPEKGGAILAANHLSFADWVFMPLALDRRITFVAKSDYFTGGSSPVRDRCRSIAAAAGPRRGRCAPA